MNKQILSIELSKPAYSGLSDADALAQLNLKNIPVSHPIQTRDIQKYLMLVDKLLPLEASLDPIAKAAKRALDLFDSFDIDDASVAAKLNQILDALIVVSVIDAADKTQILALGNSLVSKGHQLRLGSIRIGEVTEARA